MKLIWKLLRKHISLIQFAGFSVANLLGMFIVLLGVQFYHDVSPVFTEEDGFLKPEYLIVSKSISSVQGLSGESASTFSTQEIEDLKQQKFTKSVGSFTSSQYRVGCSMGIDGVANFGTDMFFESVPDRFVDTQSDKWKWDGERIPIILPKSYLAIYNFGFAQSHSLPKLNEGIIGMIDMTVIMRGNGKEDRIKGHVIGFSSRLNTILVPSDFIAWSNREFAPDADDSPTRLILEVYNPTDDAIVMYLKQRGWEIEDDKLDAGKTMYFLKVVTALVMGIGLLISILSFYILMLSIYLLVQKNTEKLQNLLLIGYSPASVSLPYQLLTIGMNAMVFSIALILLTVIRKYYMEMLWVMFPNIQNSGITSALGVGGLIFCVVSILNVIIIRRKINLIWKNS